MAKKLGLAMGGGGAWSIASLGVIKALVDEGIKIDYLAGCSMGAVIAAAYSSDFASGDTIGRTQEILRELNFRKALKMRRHNPFGLFSSEKLGHHIENALGKITFADLKIPLKIVATDFKTGEEVIFDKGPLIPALLASTSFTILFTPFEYQNRLFTDGGLSNPTPVDVARGMGADVVVGVDVTSKKYLSRLSIKPKWHHPITSKLPPLHYILNRHLGKTYAQVIDILFSNLNRNKIIQSPPDFLLTPSVTHMGQFDFKETSKFIEEGEKAVKEIIPQLKKILS